jgi:hypothetical protein
MRRFRGTRLLGSSRRRVIAGLVTAGLAALTVVTVTAVLPARATVQGVVGKISYQLPASTTIFGVNPDGSNSAHIVDGAAQAEWAPDGSRVAFVRSGSEIWTVTAAGSGPVKVTTGTQIGHPIWTPFGDFLIFSQNGKLRLAASDGSGVAGDFNENPDPTSFQDVSPAVSVTNGVAFERDNGSTPVGIYKFVPGSPTNPALLVSGGRMPDFSPDGTKLAYVVPAHPENNVTVPDQVWTADANGANPAVLTSETDGATTPKWSPDGSSVVYQAETPGSHPLKTIKVDTKAVTPLGVDGLDPAWQPINKNHVVRVWGGDGTATAIGTSQWNYDDFGGSDPNRVPAKAVVLSRSDTYLDALVGSALAIDRQAPLLITAPTNSVETRVLAEIKRVLGPTGTIYLLGGVLALPQGIEDQLKGLGYTVNRIWGNTHYDTAIAIDKVITPVPKTAIVATGANFFDALAAGAAAGANPGTVIVLTNGDTMPATSAAYLNTLNPDPVTGTAIVTGGGPGDRALVSACIARLMPSWPACDTIDYFPLVGPNEKDTALLLAQFFFFSPFVSAIATNRGWQDALTGGAMIGAEGGPLLLTDPTGLYGPLATYLNNNSGSMWDAIMLGGFLALPDTLIKPIGDAISLPDQWIYTSFQPIQGTGNGRQAPLLTHQAPTGHHAGTTAKVPGLTRTTPKTIAR